MREGFSFRAVKKCTFVRKPVKQQQFDTDERTRRHIRTQNDSKTRFERLYVKSSCLLDYVKDRR